MTALILSQVCLQNKMQNANAKTNTTGILEVEMFLFTTVMFDAWKMGKLTDHSQGGGCKISYRANDRLSKTFANMRKQCI